MLWRLSELVLFFLSLAGIVAATEIGFRLGVRHADRSDDAARGHVQSLQSAVLGLLALLLGFTFLMAVSRFDERRGLVLEEANAIGTAYLRADLLPGDSRSTAKDLLRAHVAARLALADAGVDPVRIDKANRDAAQLEQQLWALAAAASTADPHAIAAGLFAESVNEVIDVHEKRRAALDNHVPEPVIYLLFIVAMFALALIGYGCGLAKRRMTRSNLLFALLILIVITIILDVDRPRRGAITVSQESLIRLQDSMQQSGR